MAVHEMCIRDSLQLFRILALGKPELQITAGCIFCHEMLMEPLVVPLLVGGRILSVSYTHLDVYKRQVQLQTVPAYGGKVFATCNASDVFAG